MTASIISSTGRPLRRLPVRVVVGLCAVLALTALALALPGQDVSAGALAAGAALLLANFSVIAIGPRQDSQQRNVDEVIVGAILVLMPETLVWAALLYAVGRPLTHRWLGVVERVRRSSLLKTVFNTSAATAGFIAAAVTFAALTGAGASASVSALVAGSVHGLTTAILMTAVMLAADDGLRLGTFVRGAGPSLGHGAVLATIGVGVANASVGSLPGFVTLLAIGTISYGIARRQAPRVLRAAVAGSIVTVVPDLLLAEDLDAATAEGAARLLGAERGEIRSSEPTTGEIGVLLGAAPRETWLVVGGRLGAESEFDDWEHRLLSAYARLAAPARDHARAVDRLSSADDPRATILRAIGHDLRSPLAVAGSAVRTLVEHGERLPQETRTRIVGSIVSGLDRSAAILDDLLELERRRTEPVRAEAARVPDVVDTLRRTSDAVTVVPGPDVEVATDALLLGRVLDNLVQNALRHAADTEVIVWWWHDHETVTIAVDDGGEGVAVEERERILRPFTTTSEDGVGVGLGLHLAVSFAEMAGGRLEISDSDRGGASFRVVLPVHVTADEPHLSRVT